MSRLDLNAPVTRGRSTCTAWCTFRWMFGKAYAVGVVGWKRPSPDDCDSVVSDLQSCVLDWLCRSCSRICCSGDGATCAGLATMFGALWLLEAAGSILIFDGETSSCWVRDTQTKSWLTVTLEKEVATRSVLHLHAVCRKLWL